MPFSEEEWEEVAQELPSHEDAVIKNYIKGRESLVAQEKKQRSDYAFRKGMSPIARKACAIVDRIRDEERRTIWNASLEEKIASDAGAAGSAGVTVYPGQMFTHAKELMEQTKLWDIVHRMPKGSLLHAHCDAMVDFDYVFNVLLETPGMHMIGKEGPLVTPDQLADSLVAFRFYKEPRHVTPAAPSPWSPDYVAGTPVLITDVAETFPAGANGENSPGGKAGYLAWLKKRCTISNIDAVEQHHGLDHIWKKFNRCFLTLGAIIHYEPIWRKFLQRLMQLFWDDGVRWAEIRIMWPLNYHRLNSEEPETDYIHMYTVVDEEIAKFRAAYDHESFWGIRFIWTAHRAQPTRPIAESMDHCITTKMAFPHLIAGFDLVGQEDAGRPLKDALPELFWFRKQCAAEGVCLPFFLHAGECLGDGDETDSNVFDAILLGTRRIGHGFSLYKHPLLIDLVKDKKILIESCPISNEVLRLCGSIMSHPLPALLARGVPCGLNNDDPAMLGQDTAGMTHDFWQALQGWDNLGLAGLGSLAENSVRWSAFEDQTNEEWIRDIREASVGNGIKAKRLQEWSIEWEKFCLWVVTEHGEKYGDDE